MPRMTTAQIGAIVNPANGLQAYNTDDGKVYVFVSPGNVWKELSYGTGTITPPWVAISSIFHHAFIMPRPCFLHLSIILASS